MIVAGLALFGVLAYEPDNIVRELGVSGVMDEASVVIACLAVVGGCLLAGIVSLWRARRSPDTDDASA